MLLFTVSLFDTGRMLKWGIIFNKNMIKYSGDGLNEWNSGNKTACFSIFK